MRSPPGLRTSFGALPMKSLSPLARLEARLALALLLPTVLIVLSIVLVPVAANFWISSIAPRGIGQQSNFSD